MKMKTTMLAAAAVMIGAMSMSANAQAYDGRHDMNRGREVQKVVIVKEVHKQPVRQVKRAGLFDRLDINNNGTVSKWEYTSRYGNDRYANRTFNRLDVNNDGKLSQREVAAGREALQRMSMRA